MKRILDRLPSPAMVVACLALLVALGGTSYAAVRLPKNSVGTKQLKKNAVTSPKVKNNAITGADVLEGSLAQVPSAATAAQATHAAVADRATTADSASTATTAATANAAFGTFHDDGISLPDRLTVLGALNIAQAGSYAISVKFWAYNASGSDAFNSICTVTAEGDSDHVNFDAAGSTADDQEVVYLQVVHTFASAGQALLSCTDNGAGSVQIYDTKMTAVQVAHLTNTGF